MAQAFTSFVVDTTPRLHAIDLDESPQHVSRSATEAAKQRNRVVRGWTPTGLASIRVNAIARSGTAGVLHLFTNDEPPGPPSATGKLVTFNTNNGTLGTAVNLASGEGNLITKGAAFHNGTLYVLAQVIGGSPFLFVVNPTSGAATVQSNSAQFGNNDPSGLLFVGSTLYGLFHPQTGNQFIQEISTSNGSLVGAALAISLPNSRAMQFDSACESGGNIYAINNRDHLLYRLTIESAGVSGLVVGGDEAIALPGDAFGLVPRTLPTLTFPESQFVGPTDTIAGTQNQYGNPTAEGSAGGDIETLWAEESSRGLFDDKTALVTNWRSPGESGRWTLIRRVLRDGILAENQWRITTREGEIGLSLFCPRRVVAGTTVELYAEVETNLSGTPTYQWHRGTIASRSGAAAVEGFMTPSAIRTRWTVGNTAGRQVISIFVSLLGEQASAECAIEVVGAGTNIEVPGQAVGGGSNTLSDFVSTDTLPTNEGVTREGPSIYRAPTIPAHPPMAGHLGTWRSHPVAFGDEIPISYIGVDAQWQGDGVNRGAVQVFLQGVTNDTRTAVWFVVWKAGDVHYTRGRIFRGLTVPIDEIVNGADSTVHGATVNRTLAGSGVREPFPDVAAYSTEDDPFAAWRRECFRARLLAASRLVVVPLPIAIESSQWSLDVITNIEVNRILFADDLAEYVVLEPS